MYSNTELWQLKFEGACQSFEQGEMTQAQFLAYLKRLGFYGRMLEDEFAYHNQLRLTKALFKAATQEHRA